MRQVTITKKEGGSYLVRESGKRYLTSGQAYKAAAKLLGVSTVSTVESFDVVTNTATITVVPGARR
jgi:hypothetical protein